MKTAGKLRWWVPVPALAVRVRWCADAASELDALERTVLDLADRSPRTLDELSEKLGVGEDVVLSAMYTLADRGLVEAPPQIDGRWRAVGEATSTEGASLSSGWVFITMYAGPGVVPRVWTEDRLPARTPRTDDGDVIDESLASDMNIGRPSEQAIAQAIARAVARGNMACGAAVANSTSSRTEGGPLASLVRLDPLDAKGQRARWPKVTLWSAVDVLPQPGGDATTVFHEPDVADAESEDAPVSVPLARWFFNDAPSVARALREKIDAQTRLGSVVLREAGFATREEVRALARQHREELAARIGGAPVDPWPDALERFSQYLEESQEWLILYRRESGLLDALLRCQAGAIESLASSLWSSAAPLMRAWAERWRPRLEGSGLSKAEKRERFSAEAVRSRLTSLALDRVLERSLAHLEQAASNVRATLKAIDDDEPGAGGALTLWLLPLVLFEQDEATSYARMVKAALSRDPDLFEHLDSLISARNSIVHQRQEAEADLSNRPEDIDLRLMQAATALASALEVSSLQD